MKKVFIILMCVLCLVGCTERNKSQIILLKARWVVSKPIKIVFFNSSVNDIVHVWEKEDGEEKNYYFHYSGSQEFWEEYRESTLIETDDPQFSIKQEMELLKGMLGEKYKIFRIHDSLSLKKSSYFYRSTPEIEQKHQLQGTYEIIITTIKNKITNINLKKVDDNEKIEYILDVQIKKVSIWDVL